MTDTPTPLDTVRNNARKAGAAMDAFPAICETFIKESGMPVGAFGFQAAGQADFVHNLRKGRDFRRSTMRKVLSFVEGKPHSV